MDECGQGQLDLSTTAPSHLAQGFFLDCCTFSLFSFSIQQTHLSFLANVYTMHIHLM